ncbi:MAG: hypothetical protein D6680_06960 [Cyanobacteria bacterium J007]|jgi:tetratricopeptide (TPR) repeat protein/predicted O-methyltransferase YrrM|nr:MAG: hypothetical protein D6680_06960 [Cyanobacteria bacterium J007]
MKILVVALYAINTPHFETELEIIQNHLDAGDEVVLLGCNAHLEACDVNMLHYISPCLQCIGRRQSGLKLLSQSVTVKPIDRLTPQNVAEIDRLPKAFASLDELKTFSVDNFDLGYAVLSSLISAVRDPKPDLKKYANLIAKLIKSSASIYRSLQNYLAINPVDRVYVYNGRYAPMRAVLRACQSMDIDCFTHEKSRTIHHYALFENTTIHDIDYIDRQILKAWEAAGNDRDRRQQIAEEFFLERARGISRTWIAFTKDQQDNLLPDNWDDRKTNIVIFTSSEDEFAAIGELWKNPLYPSQIEGLEKIVNSLKDREDIQVYIRIHPNLKNVKNEQTTRLDRLQLPNLTLIPAESPVSTYTLLKKASKVISFGSTVGIEAVYWGTPSILAGKCLYRNLGSTYNPTTHDELMQMLDRELPPKDKEGALMYGYYLNSYGIEFKHYQAQGIYEGLFKGVKIQPDLFDLIAEVGLETGSDVGLERNRKIMKSLPQNKQILEQAIAALNSNDNERALMLFDRALSFDSNALEINYGKAIALARSQKIQEAIVILEQLLVAFPEHFKARQLLAELQPNLSRSSLPKTGAIQDLEFRELRDRIDPYTHFSDRYLYSLFLQAKQICQKNIAGNFVEITEDNGGSTALLAAIVRRYSRQPRWLYSFVGNDGDRLQKTSELCTQLDLNSVIKLVRGNLNESVAKLQPILGLISLLHLADQSSHCSEENIDRLTDQIVNEGAIQISNSYWIPTFDRLGIHSSKYRVKEAEFSVICPQKWDLNTNLDPQLVREFEEDDPTRHGIESQMSLNERFQLYYAVRHLLPQTRSPLRFIEIGSYAGASLFFIVRALKRWVSQIQGFAIDPGGHSQLYRVLPNLKNDVTHLRLFSYQAAPKLKAIFDRDGHLPSLMFIDGDHTYEGVKRDIIDYFPLLAPGGVAIFHDYLPPLTPENREAILFHHEGNEPGIRQACQELMENTYGCQLLDLPLLYPTAPGSTAAHLPIIPGISSTLRAYRKPLN